MLASLDLAGDWHLDRGLVRSSWDISGNHLSIVSHNIFLMFLSLLLPLNFLFSLLVFNDIYFFKKLEYNCFTMWCSFLLYNNMNQLCVYVSPTRWTWVWGSSGSWWWTGTAGVLQSMGSQRVGQDWATEVTDWYVYPLPLELSSHPHPHPAPLGHHRALSWAPCTVQLLPTSCLFHGSIYMSMLLSQCVPPSPPRTVPTSPCFISASLFLPCKSAHQHLWWNITQA